MSKKLVAILLAVVMMMTLLPTVALADGTVTDRVCHQQTQIGGYWVNIYNATTYQSTSEQGGTISDNRWSSYLLTQGSWTFTATPKPGYEFTGWTFSGPSGAFSVSGNSLTVTYKNNSQNYEATASFRYLPRYTLTANASAGGSITRNPNQATYPRNDSVTLTAVPADGYYFTGWTGALSGTANPATVTMDGDKTVGAMFALLPTYSLSVNVNPSGVGSVSKNPDIASYWQGRNVTLTANVPSGYRFSGWTGNVTSSSNPVTFAVTSNMAVTANFIKQYSITLSTSGGGELDSAGAVAGWRDENSSINLGNAKPDAYGGNRFVGWRDNGTGQMITDYRTTDYTFTLTGNRSFTAVFGDIEWLDTSVDSSSRGYLGNDLDGHYGRGSVVNLNWAQPTAKTGYTFDHWEEYNSGWEDVPLVGGQPIITIGDWNYFQAVFVRSEYTVSFEENGGTPAIADQTIVYNNKATRPTTVMIKTGYRFDNWYADSACNTLFDFNTKIKADTVIYAKWIPNTYTVVYNANGGSGTTASSSHTYDVAKALTANGFSKNGYTFAGWATSPGGTAVYANSQSVTNLSAVNSATVNLYAVWAAEAYDIDYELDGGAAINPDSYTIQSSAITLANPTKTGYTFTGWTGTGFLGNTMTVVIPAGSTGNRAYTAHWSKDIYTISYDLSGGVLSSPNPGSYSVDTPSFTLNNPTKTGYTFMGWTDPSGMSTPEPIVTIAQGSTGNLSYKALFLPNNYEIAYNANGGTGTMNRSMHVYDAAWPLNTNAFAWTGHTFLGWSSSATGGVEYTDGQSVVNLAAEDGAVFTLYAVWETIDYTITYNLDNGSVSTPNPTVYTVDTPDFTLTNPTRNGYMFAGWTGTDITGSTTSVTIAQGSIGVRSYTATWTANDYTVKYEGNGSDGGATADSGHTFDTASALTVNGFTKTGYTFAGWATIADGAVVYGDGASVMNLTNVDGGVVTLFAKWTANGYTVKYDGNGNDGGATADSSHIYDASSALTANGFAKTGYTFAGWATSAGGTVVYNDGASVLNLTSVDGGVVTLFAKWTANDYTVKYDGNGSDGGATADSSHIYDAASALTANGFTKTGYTFAGWATSSGGAVVYGNGASVKNLTSVDNGVVTLFAKWTINTYTVRFVDYDGAELSTQTVDWNTAATAPADPTRTGYRFTGWDTDFSVVKDNLTVTAQYVRRTYTVTFLDYDGTTIDTQSVRWNEGATAPAAPEREGYTFTSWDTSFDPVTSNLTVTALYSINTYTVTFADFDGEVLATQTVDWNTAATAPADPSREGFKFTGWDTAFDAVKADLTVTALYEETITDEEIPDTNGTIEDEPVPVVGGAFAWWWIPIIVGLAAVLFLLIFFVVRRKKKEEEENA